MALTAHERASAHYRAAKRYMSYGDAPKSKAHMKRALYYGFGNDEESLRKEITDAMSTGLDKNGIVKLVVRTFRVIHESMITPDRSDSGKISAIDKLKDTKLERSGALDRMDPLVPVDVATDHGTTKQLHVTKPRSLYTVKDGTLANGSIGLNLTDIHDNLRMKTAFCRTVDETRRVHTAVREELNRDLTRILASILENLRKTTQELQSDLQKQAPQNETNKDLHRTARVLATFWKNAHVAFVNTNRGMNVEPLAHDNPMGLGVAVFQLMVVFDESMLVDVVNSVLDDLDRTEDWSNDDKSNAKAWMGMLGLLLDGVNGAKKDKEGKIVGKYYTLEWREEGPESTRTRSDFGRKYR